MTTPAKPDGFLPELPEPAWTAIDTPGADLDLTFVQTDAEACDICEGSEYDRARINLYTSAQLHAYARAALEQREAEVFRHQWLAKRIENRIRMLRAEAAIAPNGYTFGQQAAADKCRELADQLARDLLESNSER